MKPQPQTANEAREIIADMRKATSYKAAVRFCQVVRFWPVELVRRGAQSMGRIPCGIGVDDSARICSAQGEVRQQ